ncbi:hypothetical protein ACFY5C_26780 [Streptomyces sp. NPDC012935]|uniref:hypothetical protein n=1 Tax=Streptomyces sp. NPDC012935 TaxID=3364857 RepID=UPI00368EAB5B
MDESLDTFLAQVAGRAGYDGPTGGTAQNVLEVFGARLGGDDRTDLARLLRRSADRC